MAKKPKVKPKPYTPARVKKLAKNPGERSKIPTRLLPQQYRAEREKNERLNAPVTPGSSLTNRQLSRDTKSYTTQKYGQGDLAERQGIQAQQNLNRDQTGWYDKYLQDLRTHAANVNTFADQNVQQTGAYGQGLAQAGQQALAGQADPISRGMNAQAADTRARYAGSFVGQASAVGTANKNYASTVANVVGPGQKLQAQAGGASTLRGLQEKAAVRADVKGADVEQYRSGRISDEQKILAADAIAQGKSAVEIAKIAGRTTVAKIGAETTKSTKSPPVPYYTWAQWNGMSPAEKRAAVKDYQKKPKTGAGTPGSKPKGKSPYSAPSVQSTAWQKIDGAADVIRGQYKNLTLAQIQAKPKLPIRGAQLRAAYEIARNGHISSATARALHKDGLQVKGRYRVKKGGVGQTITKTGKDLF